MITMKMVYHYIGTVQPIAMYENFLSFAVMCAVIQWNKTIKLWSKIFEWKLILTHIEFATKIIAQ